MTAEFWDNWQRPWTIQQCHDYYVRGPKIGQRALSDLSGVSVNTIKDRSRKDSWVEQRTQFHRKRTAETEKKVIDAIANEDSEIYARLTEEHLQAWQTVRRLSMVMLDSLEHVVNCAFNGTTPDTNITNALNAIVAVNGKNPYLACVNTIRIAIAGEREAEFMQYADPNILSRYADELGYDLIERSTCRQIFPQGSQDL